jgi:arylsulfatase A-like enzyme
MAAHTTNQSTTTRRQFLKYASQSLAVGTLAGSLIGCEPMDTAGKRPRPNIIFLFSDDQRSDAMGCAGNKVIQTPEHDKLASQGVMFENCFVTTSICCVSRASVLTGQYARRHGIDDFVKMFSEQQLNNMYPSLMQQNGYWTGFIGKWGVGANTLANIDKASEYFDFWAGGSHQTNFWHEKDCPFVTCDPVNDKIHNVCNCPDDFVGTKNYNPRIGRKDIKNPVHQTTEIVPNRVRQFLQTRDKAKPFCLSISLKTPHGPWEDYSDSVADLYKDIEIPSSPTATKEHSDKLPAFLRKSLEGKNGARLATEKPFLQNALKNYYRSISSQDEAIGKIRQALTDTEQASNTIIVFIGDNGHYFGEHGLFGKWLMGEESIRVPCIIYDPRLTKSQKGTRRKQTILNIDMAPTMLDMAGVKVPEEMQGRSLVPLLKGKKPKWRDQFFYEHVYTHGGAIVPCEGVRTSDYKYIHYYDQQPPVEQLYDMRNDAAEINDLAGDEKFAAVLLKLRKQCSQYRESLK